ncbi:MAG: mucoidy inhibitor MuiA family protein [Rhodobacteraceae bacterium]|nr:mucoidy inhibitor MuiA family protein [Paracoccaceae bacterium]
MRFLMSVSLVSLIAGGAMAEQFSLDSNVSAVTVYGQGATITRAMHFDVPAGQHTLVISDIPYEFHVQTLQFKGGEGLVINATQLISQRPTLDGQQLERREELENMVSSFEAQIRIKQEESAAAGLIINAASARIKLLDSIGGQQAQSAAGALEAQTISAETLMALVTLVGTETLSALQDAQTARTEIAALNRDMQDLQKDLQKAREDLARLVEPSDWSNGVSLQVSAESAASGVLQISYVVGQASWHPVYRFMLNTETETMTVKRSVTIAQYTTEDWDDAAITVSTATPYSGGSFYMPNSNIARYEALPPPVGLLRMSDASGMAFAAPEALMIVESSHMGAAEVNFQGITATYALPAGTIVTGDRAETTVALSENSFEVELSARAGRGSDAYVMAEWENTSNEPFLPGLATFFRDGAFVSDDDVSMVAAGATTALGFGKIDGLQVKRTTLRREDGSSGVLTTSNDRVVEYELSVENVSNRAWNVIIYDRVPVSEQEELIVDWSARPRPTETDVEGRRGVLAWEFALESGASKVIKLSYELQWPEGNELRVQR